MSNDCLNLMFCEDSDVDIRKLVKPFISDDEGIGLYLDFNKILGFETADIKSCLASRGWGKHTNSYGLELPKKGENGVWSLSHKGFPCVSFITANSPKLGVFVKLAKITNTNISLYAFEIMFGYEVTFKAFADGSEPFYEYKNFTTEEINAIYAKADGDRKEQVDEHFISPNSSVCR